MFQQELLNELKEKFEQTKKELGFKSSFKEVNEIFFISNTILNNKFVNEFFIKQLSKRIVDHYNTWASYLHGLIMPNPSNIFMVMENKMIDNEEKEKIHVMIKKSMELTSKSILINLKDDKKAQAKFIDDSVKLWKGYFKTELIKIMEKVNEGWKENKK